MIVQSVWFCFLSSTIFSRHWREKIVHVILSYMFKFKNKIILIWYKLLGKFYKKINLSYLLLLFKTCPYSPHITKFHVNKNMAHFLVFISFCFLFLYNKIWLESKIKFFMMIDCNLVKRMIFNNYFRFHNARFNIKTLLLYGTSYRILLLH